MNLYNYFEKNVNLNNVETYRDDMKELAVVRYVMKEASKLFYRDYTFFLNKENITERDVIYNKKIDLKEVNDFSIVCKSYCDIIKELLKNKYGIDSEFISAFSDRYRHLDLMITTKSGKKYIVAPLNDLIEMQVGLKTNNFASKKYYDSMYANVVDDISFLTEEELEEIDDKIGYKNENIYLNEKIEKTKKIFENIEEFLKTYKDKSTKLLGREYNGEELSEDEKIRVKLEYISSFMNDRKYLNGFVDFLMFSDIILKELFSKEEREKINTYNFFVEKKDLVDERLDNVLTDRENRRRGRVVNFNGKNYIFALNKNVFICNDTEWKDIIEKNNIFIKPEYPVQLLKYLKENGADRNIVHNNEFLRLFNKFETALINKGKSIEEIKTENVIIQDEIILTKFGEKYISYKIENGNLVVKDFEKNIKYIIFYEDEGRKISYRTEKILDEEERINLCEFDSNGIFDLKKVQGIEDLVTPLKNGKFLSRNASYYESRTYSELAEQRRNLVKRLTEECSKKNQVILEYLSNSSAKVYFEELKKKINNKEHKALEAQKCLEEDCENIIRLFQNKPLLKPNYMLPEGNEKILDRHIEMDNKQILYLFCSNLKFKKDKHIIIPGLGAVMIGPMLKALYGFEYTNILFSLYSKDEELRKMSESKNFEELFSDDRWLNTPNELVLIDDNVSSCNTMNIIRTKLKEKGKDCKFGAIKYNWKFYKQVKYGELGHEVFDIKEVDFLTIVDDPGYWIMRDSVNALKQEDGEAYINIMHKEGLRKEGISDIFNLMKLAEKFSREANVNLYDMNSKDIKKSSAFLCLKLKEQIEEINRSASSIDRSKDE